MGPPALSQQPAERSLPILDVTCMIQIIFVTRAAIYQKRVEEPKHSVIGKHFDDERNLRPLKLRTNFNFVCNFKLVCLICEKLLMRKKRPKLNTQSDLIRLNLWLKSHGLLFHYSNSCDSCTHLFCKCNVKYANN